MNRREFIRRGAWAVACSGALSAGALSKTVTSDSKAKNKRLGCTTVCFRMRFPQTQPKNYSASVPALKLPEAPAFFAEKLGVHNIELWSRHFEDTSLKYCRKLRAAAKKVGSKVINIQLDEPGYNLSSNDPAQRSKSIEFVKRWMDRAAACGATSLRANTGGSAKEKLDVSVTGDSFRQLAEYGEETGVKILIENHGGSSSNPDNIVVIIKAVNSTFCRMLPDFGNMPANFRQQRDEFLKKLYPYARSLHSCVGDVNMLSRMSLLRQAI